MTPAPDLPAPATERLRESEEQLRLALEASDTGVWTWDLGTDAVTWSPECYRIHGLTEEEFDGTGAGFFQCVHPDDRERVERTVRAASESRGRYDCEFRILRHGGGVLWVANRGRATYGAAGRPLRMVGTITDVTQRKRAEEELQRARSLLQAVIDGSTALVFAKDLEGRYFLTNQGWLDFVGLSAEQAAGITDEEAFGPEVAARVQANDRRVLETGEQLAFEESAMVRGRSVTYLSSKFPLTGPDGRVYAICGVSADITELKRTQAALAAREQELQTLTNALSEQDRRKDEFLATLSHELRNPLAPLRNGLAVLRMGCSQDQAAKVLGMMDRQLGLMVHLVDDLLDLSRVSRGKITLRPERLTVREVVDAAVEACRPAIHAKEHALEVNLPAEPLEVQGDRTRLVQVLSNLLTNAAKYTDAGGRLYLTAAREGGQAVLRVADNGVGIAPELLPTIWDMFSQVRETLDKAQGGLGIGLSLVRKLVEMHGGTVAAESPGLGRGSTFTVRLQLAEAVHPRTEVPPAALGSDPALRLAPVQP
ncbi:MAG TPA: PAS domain S-box protein [Thermoanaerobaculia bacterium]|nr:PAS domain S-box protein [Thermoanaerobaculia bacterium]